MSEPSGDFLNVRDAWPEELDEVAIVIGAAYREYALLFPSEAWETYARNIVDVRSRLGETELIVAERSGNILGVVTFYPDGSRPGGEGWPAGWAGIRLLAVHPKYRGQGIARALMHECFRRCRELGIATVGLHTSEVMATARGMYERMGFVRADEFDFYPTDGTVVIAYLLDL